jgi:hypothetical protein
VLAEDQRRRALHNAWLRGNRLPAAEPAPPLNGASADVEPTPLEQPELEPLIRLVA